MDHFCTISSQLIPTYKHSQKLGYIFIRSLLMSTTYRAIYFSVKICLSEILLVTDFGQLVKGQTYPPVQTYSGDTFGLTYESAKHKVCNLKNSVYGISVCLCVCWAKTLSKFTSKSEMKFLCKLLQTVTKVDTDTSTDR